MRDYIKEYKNNQLRDIVSQKFQQGGIVQDAIKPIIEPRSLESIQRQKELKDNGTIKPTEHNKISEWIYSKYASLPEGTKKAVSNWSDINDMVIQPYLAAITLKPSLNLIKYANASNKAIEAYNAANAIRNLPAMQKASDIGFDAAMFGNRAANQLNTIESNPVNLISDIVSRDVVNLFNKPLVKTAQSVGISGNNLSIGYGAASIANAGRNLEQPLNAQKKKDGGKINWLQNILDEYVTNN